MIVSIIDYAPELQPYFETLNKAWIEKYFALEPVDTYTLEQPEEALLRDGGAVLFAKRDNHIVGTVALKFVSPGVMELTKMAVDEQYRRMGIGKKLVAAATEKARALGAHTLMLYSNTVLGGAIALYRSMGFVEIAVEENNGHNKVYTRSDIKMELPLADTRTPERVRTLVESYGKAHDKIMACLAEIPRDMWDWQPPHGKWTIRQNILHLADSEANSYIRCRRCIAEPASTVMAYNQDVWATTLQYEQQNTSDALELFRLLRALSYNLIRNLPDATWNNTIEHPENGTMTLWDWLRCYENHTHVFQMQRVYNAWKKERAAKEEKELTI